MEDDKNNNSSLERIIGTMLSDIGSEKSRLDRLEISFNNRLTEFQASYRREMTELLTRFDIYQTQISKSFEKQEHQLADLLSASQKADGQREASTKYQSLIKWFVGIVITEVAAILGLVLHIYLLKTFGIW